MPRYTDKDCAADRWWLCYRQGRCWQTAARARSASSAKPAEYPRRENESVNFQFLVFIFIFLFRFDQWLSAVVRYLNERRLNGNEAQTQSHPVIQQPHTPTQPRAAPSSSASTNNKRSAPPGPSSHDGQTKRPRGRPKGSKNRTKDGSNDTAGAWWPEWQLGGLYHVRSGIVMNYGPWQLSWLWVLEPWGSHAFFYWSSCESNNKYLLSLELRPFARQQSILGSSNVSRLNLSDIWRLELSLFQHGCPSVEIINNIYFVYKADYDWYSLMSITSKTTSLQIL